MLASTIIESIRLVRPVVFMTLAISLARETAAVVYEVYADPVVIIIATLAETVVGDKNGVSVPKEEWKVIPGHREVLITEEVFERVSVF